MSRAIVTATTRIIPLDFHVRISESQLDDVALLVGYIYGELLRSAGRTKGLVQLDRAALILGLHDLRELTKR
jgi:hypothetical protein